MVRIEVCCEQMFFLHDFMKIDVEGHELAVLNGSKKLFVPKYPPMLMIEILTDHREILQILSDNGYKISKPNAGMIDGGFTFGNGNIFAPRRVVRQERLGTWTYHPENNSQDV